jgi:hypothetical protein
MPSRQGMDGPNGNYNICSECGECFGIRQSDVMGMWDGYCDICGLHAGMTNALHDWGMSDKECGVAKRKYLQGMDLTTGR